MIITVFFHELGHYLIAIQQNIYRGWGIHWGSVVIKLEHKFNSRWDYLSGFACGFIGMPLGIIFELELGMMILLQVFLSLGDFFVLIFYGEKVD